MTAGYGLAGPGEFGSGDEACQSDAVIAICRFRVDQAHTAGFREQATAAVTVLSSKTGFLSADLGRNVDDAELWTLATRWANVGSYRRALGGYESKIAVVPLLSLAIDEPSAYETDDSSIAPH